MSWLSKKASAPTLDGLFEKYSSALENGPADPLKTLHPLSELPADKPLMKAVLLAKAYEFGPSADEVLKAGFVLLANFQTDTREPANKHLEIAREMEQLGVEWEERVRYPSEAAHA